MTVGVTEVEDLIVDGEALATEDIACKYCADSRASPFEIVVGVLLSQEAIAEVFSAVQLAPRTSMATTNHAMSMRDDIIYTNHGY